MARSIGILVTGSPPEELADRYRHYGAMAEDLLRGADPDLQFRHYDIRAGEFPSSPRDHDGWLITGSRHGAYEELPWILRLAEFVRALEAARQPLVGICFGHQLIARALGGEVIKAPQGWGVGVHEAEVLEPAPWMDADAARYRLVVSHQDQVTALPAGAERIAGSDFCPIAMYRIGGHVFAMQAHPEFTRQYSRELMELRRGLIGDARIEPGIASLASEVDSAEVARWVADFLNRAWTD